MQAGEPLQLDGGLAPVDADVGVAAVRGDVVVRLQIGERMSLDVQLVARHEVGDDVLAALLGTQESEHIGAAAADHGVVTRTADEGIGAATPLEHAAAGAADEFRGSAAAHERHLAADRDVFGYPVRMGDLKNAAIDRPAAERAVAGGAPHRGMALFVDGVVAGAEVDGVMTLASGLGDLAAGEER